MSYCRVCGDESTAAYRPAARQTLCDTCAADTPRKASREGFHAFYWGTGPDAPGIADPIAREFYEDYLRSTHTLDTYKESTTSDAW